MCNCKTEIEKKLKDSAAIKIPDSQDVSVELKGYAFILNDEGMDLKNCMSFEVEYKATVKGVLKNKKLKQSMIGSFCMFCGVAYKKPDAA